MTCVDRIVPCAAVCCLVARTALTLKALVTVDGWLLCTLQANFACSGHMQSLNKIYNGVVVAVNLIDTKGDQLMLGNAYANAVSRANAMGANVQYVCPGFTVSVEPSRHNVGMLVSLFLP